MSMLLFLPCDPWSIIGDSGCIVSSLVSSASAFFSFHLLTGKMGPRPFDNTLAQHDAVELVKTGEGRVDLVSELSPLETLRVAESHFAKVVKSRESLGFVFGQFNMLKAGSPWLDVRLRQAVNMAI